jgi:uncharacterized protein (DUF885 family)
VPRPNLASFAATLLLLTACGSPPPHSSPPSSLNGPVADDTSDDAAIARAGQKYVDLLVATSPEGATGLGLHTRDTELDDRTPAAFESTLQQKQALYDELASTFAHPHASRAARTDLLIMMHSLAVEIRVDRELRPLERQPDLYESPMDAIFLMTARDYAPAAERAQNVILRMEKIPDVVAHAKANLKTPPRVWTEIAIERAAGAKAFFEEQRGPLTDALPSEKPRIEAALRTATLAYTSYGAFLQKTVLPASTTSFAIGRPLFEFMLHDGYFLKEDSEALLTLGKRIFGETSAQMTALAKKMDPHAQGWPEITARLKANHPTADGLRASYAKEVARARAFLVAHDAVPFPPGDDCEVVDTPPFQRSTITAAYDQPRPFDKVTRGFFFVTPVDRSLPPDKQEEMLRENDHGDQVDTAVHETYPGHHLQISFARLHPSLVRKATPTAILEEGWGLYSEELMNELGYYTDEERMMQLEWTLVRAARVIIDIGLHTRGMSFDDAVRMLTAEVHLEHELALSEVKRYTESPTQPLSYLVGREQLFRIRERYLEREKERYSLKRFHGEVLSRGGIAPGLLEEEMFEP